MGQREKSMIEYARAVEVLPKLYDKYGSEEEARKRVLESLSNSNTVTCFQCFHVNQIHDNERRMILCEKCKKEVWRTARTHFHKAQKFLPRLLLMGIIELGIILSANQAAKLLNVSTNFIGLFYRKTGYIAAHQFSDSAATIESKECMQIVIRRSIKTPADKHPKEEELVLQNKQDSIESNFPNSEISPTYHLDNSDLSRVEIALVELLSDRSITFDSICAQVSTEPGQLLAALMTLQLKGLVASEAGEKYRLSNCKNSFPMAKNPKTTGQNKIAKLLTNFISERFQGVSRKNLQIYAALFWISKDRNHWKEDSLLSLCAASPQVSYDEILNYETPLTFKVFAEEDTSLAKEEGFAVSEPFEIYLSRHKEMSRRLHPTHLDVFLQC